MAFTILRLVGRNSAFGLSERFALLTSSSIVNAQHKFTFNGNVSDFNRKNL